MGVLDRYRDEKKKPSVLDRYREQPQYGYSQGGADAKPYRKDEPEKEDPFVTNFKASTERLVQENPRDTIRLAGREFPVDDYSSDPSRDIPVIGSVLKAVDKVKELTLPVAQVAGELYTPGGGLANASTLASNVGAKVAQKAPQLTNTLGGRVVNEAIKEGVTGVPLAMAQALAQGQDLDEIAKQGALGGVGGAALGGALPLVGAGAKTAFAKLFNRTGNQEAVKATQEILALPAPRQRGNVNTVQTPDVINASAPPTRVRPQQNVNPYRQKYEELINVAKDMKFTPGREIEELDEMWGRMAGREDPGLDELIDLAYPRQRAVTPEGLQTGRMKQASGLGPNVERNVLSRYRDTEVLPSQPRRDITQEVDSIPVQSKPAQSSALDRYKEPKQPEVLPSQPKPEAADDIIQSKEPRIRDKVVSFLDEQEKAARARLKAKGTTLSSMPLDQYADHAIILAAKAGKGTIKLADAAEFLVKEFGEEIRPHVQSIVNRARGIAKEAERRATKEAQDARTFNATDSGDASTFRSKVNRDKKSNKVPFSRRFEKIRTQLVDDLAPLEGVEKRIRGKVSSAEDSLYKAGRLFRGVPEKANRIVKDRLAPIINGIEEKGYTSSDLGDYALAIHAKDVNARDIKSGFTNKEIDEVISRLGTKEMEAARKEIIKISDDMLAELEKEGVISRDLVKSLKERYPNYMPLFRNFDDEAVNFSDGLSKALANVTSPIKGLKGSERKVIDPFESMVKNIFQSTNAVERNKVASQLAKLAKDDPDANFIRELTEGEEVGRKNVVSVLVGGNKVRYEVEPEVYKAMLNLDQESTNTLIKVFQKPASLLRAGATLTPEFSLRNPLRDVVQAFVVSESGFNPLIDFPVGLIQSISKGNLYKDWVKELGAYGNIISNDRNVHKEALERVLKESPSKKFVNVLNGKSLIKVLRAISDTTESATKVGEFRAALRKGASKEEAAFRSRDIMDFGRAGNSIRQTNKIVAFLNANIQGKSKLIRAFKANPAGFTARAFTSITVPTIGVFLMQKYMTNDAQKLTIDEAPAWMTDTFWLVPIPGTDQVARLPKPFDLGTLFSNLPERALKYTYNNDKEAFDGFAKKAMADASMPGMITGLLPFIEGMSNYSFFQGRNIIPMGEEYRNYEDQFNINTTESAKFLAKGAEKLTGGEGMFKNFSSPRIMDNTIKGLTAGLGTYATSAIDVLLDKFNVTNNPVRPEKAPSQQPLSKAFLVNPLQGGKSTEELYNLKDKLTRDKGSAKLNNKSFMEKAKLTFINEQTGKMSDITKQIRDIENSMILSAAEKRKQIEPLMSKRNKIAQDAIKYIEVKESTTK